MFRSSPYWVLAAGLVIGAGCSRTNTQTATNGATTTPATQGEASREAPSPNTTGTAQVRYVSAVDAHSNTDLYFGNDKLFSTTGAENPTGYKAVPAERRDFSLKQAGKPDGMEIEKNSEGLKNGDHYTVVAYEDKDAKPVLRVFNDDESAPKDGKAKVRLIHAAPGMQPISLYAAGHKDKLAGESRFSEASTWQDVDPVTGRLIVRAGDGKDAVQTSVPLKGLEAGKLYTIVVEGGPKSGQPLHVVDMVDTPNS